MADRPINLNRVRKDRARKAAKRLAEENVVKHGAPKVQRVAEARRQARDDKRLDGHKQEGTPRDD